MSEQSEEIRKDLEKAEKARGKRVNKYPGVPRSAKSLVAPHGEYITTLTCHSIDCDVRVQVRGAVFPQMLCCKCQAKMRVKSCKKVD